MSLMYWMIALTVCVAGLTAVGAVIDWRTMKLPNKLTVPACLAGLVFHLIWGAVTGGWMGMLGHLWISVAGFAVGFGILFVLWVTGGGRGGDVKFMGAVGAWCGPEATLAVFIVSAIYILMLSVWVVIKGALSGDLKKIKKSVRVDPNRKNKSLTKRPIPYGVSLALATWTVLATQAIPHLTIMERSMNQ